MALPFRRYRTSGDPLRALSIEELRAMALRRLPAVAAEYLEGGSEDELSLTANRQAFRRFRFAPRLEDGAPPLAPVSGQLDKLPFPYVIAPTGLNGLLWRDADMALARAAAAAGIPLTQSTVSNRRLEDIAEVPGLEHWFQLYLFSSMELVEALLARATVAGVKTLVVTIDANISASREWNARLYSGEGKLTLRARIDAALHPGWMRQVWLPGLPSFPNLADWLGEGAGNLLVASRWIRQHMAARVTWEQVRRLRALWPGRMLIKGVGHVADAERAMTIGADGVILGNHGGRQLDGALSGLELLPEVRSRLGRHAIILIEGGVRRGSDILKARLLGADAVMGGRATLYGVAAGGERGVGRAIAILREEYELSRALLGDGDLIATAAGA